MVPVIDLDATTSRNGTADNETVNDPIQTGRVAGLDLHVLEPERPKKPQRSIFARVSTAHFLMAVFGLLGFGLTLYLLQQSEATSAIVVANEDMSVGVRLDADSYSIREVPVDGPLTGRALSPDQVTDSMALLAPLQAGAPILASMVAEESPLDALSSFSVPIDDERALGGEFQAGDRVHLISVIEFGNGLEKTAVSTYVAVDVPVLSDREQDTNGFGSSLSDYYVAVGLDPSQSLEASSAMMRGRLEIVRAGDESVDVGMAAISTTGGMTIVERTQVGPLLAGIVDTESAADESVESDADADAEGEGG